MAARSFFAAVALLAFSTSARAVTLTTPVVDNFIGNGDFDCVLTNIGAKPVSVASVKLITFGGTDVTPTFDVCSATTLAPHSSCDVGHAFGTVSEYCTATVKGSTVRLGLNLTDRATSKVIIVAPGTK